MSTYVKRVSICSGSEWSSLELTVTHLTIGVNCLNDLSEMALDRFILLKELVIGDKSLNGLSELKLEGLNRLERVVVGSSSFRRAGTSNALHVRECPSLKSVVIGDDSFAGFGMIEIASVPVLEELQIGASCFAAASFELKGGV